MYLSHDTILPDGVLQTQIMCHAASVVVINEQKQILLMLRDDRPLWQNIGGEVGTGENFLTALQRHLTTQTRLSFEHFDFTGDYFGLLNGDGAPQYRHEKTYLAIMPDDMTPRLGASGMALEWFDRDKLPANIAPRFRTRIAETFDGTMPKTAILTSPNQTEFMASLKPEQIYGLERWQNHPRVLARKALPAVGMA